jgi:hypothetical protein
MDPVIKCNTSVDGHWHATWLVFFSVVRFGTLFTTTLARSSVFPFFPLAIVGKSKQASSCSWIVGSYYILPVCLPACRYMAKWGGPGVSFAMLYQLSLPILYDTSDGCVVRWMYVR